MTPEARAEAWMERWWGMDRGAHEERNEALVASFREAEQAAAARMRERCARLIEIEFTRTHKTTAKILGKKWMESLVYLVRALPLTEGET